MVELVSALVLAVALKNVGSFNIASLTISFYYMTGVSVNEFAYAHPCIPNYPVRYGTAAVLLEIL